MNKILMQNAEKYRKRRVRKKLWQRIVSVMGCIVVFCTTYALILPAITLEQTAYCGHEAHLHEEACYAQEPLLICTETENPDAHIHGEECYAEQEVFTCQQVEQEAHIHDASCYSEQEAWICQQEEQEPHTHIEACFTEEACYVCGLEEFGGHVHEDSCYVNSQSLTCQTPEAEAHHHGDGCYELQETYICTPAEGDEHVHTEECITTQSVLICAMEETEGHTHGEECYEALRTLACETEESEGHTHTEKCLGTQQVLNCTLEETEGHTHGDECMGTERVLSCTLEETEGHSHTDECKGTELVLICETPELEGHIHTEECYDPGQTVETLICEAEEHEHILACYSDPTADVESASVWEATLPELTGVWADDVLAIAQSQIGYTESTRNYVVLEDGETVHGYTRYGEWYGDAYGDWCAMFVSFCIHYAEVTDYPQEASCSAWVELLAEQGYYTDAAGAIPQKGDLIFFEKDGLSGADHIGLVLEVNSEDGTVKTIEGNSAEQVRSVEYDLTDEEILGFGSLPVQLTEQEQAEVDYVISLIDALPSADEIDAKLAEFEAVEDYEGEEAWYTETCQQVARAYDAYSNLTEVQKEKVTNADKLLELEYIWSQTTYSSVIASDAPTTTWYTSTKDFVELNLYDYNGNVNTDYWNKTTWYPGFQWNGGAYSNDSGDSDNNDYRYSYSYAGIGIPYAVTDRNYIDSIDFGNSLITNFSYGYGINGDYTKAVNATNVVKTSAYYSSTGPINWIYGNSSEGYTNKPIGTSTTDTTQSGDVMSRTLVDGYPALSDGTMLDYLFKEGNAVDKLNTESIDGLFQQDSVSGEYSYNSRLNHAEYTNNFFQLYDEIITPNFITYPFGNFLPLNKISDTSDATQVGAFNTSGGMKTYVNGIIADLQAAPEDWQTSSRTQLVTMLQEYQENWKLYPRTINGTSNNWTNLSPANAIRDYFWGDTDGAGDKPSANTDFVTQEFLDRLYNIDWDVATNFFFGMEMKMTFMQPRGGMTGNDTNGDGKSDYPMVFYFTGDDDVWVYIDDVLFLDLSGIHRHVGGKIDFVNGKVHYYALDTANGGDVSSTPYATYTFAQILEAAGKSTSGLNSAGTFADYSTHSFNFYYMERGSGSSVCRLNFNFPLLKRNSISVTKENVTVDGSGAAVDAGVLGNPDYYFNIVTAKNDLFVGPGSVTGVTQYKIMDSAGNILKNADGTDQVFTTDQYGIFTLKAGQTAVFEGIEENEGTYFVQELIKEADNGQYPKVYINDTETRYNALIDWSYRTYFSESDSDKQTGPYGYKWYGRSGYDTDSSSNSSFYFEQQNHLNVDLLGELTITKVLEGDDTGETFNMEVTLDGEKLPVGTKYTVGGAEKTVTTEGVITLAPGEMAVIPNIISGTRFTVRETNGGSYTVSYTAQNADETSTDGASITGVVRTNTSVAVTVTNTEQGTQVSIPVTKGFTNPVDGTSHSYTFTLEQVTDSTGSTTVDGSTVLTENAVFTGNSYSFDFVLNYFKHKLDSLPATFYYRITESSTGTDALPNEQVFVAEVEVRDDSSGITASLIAVHGSDNSSADFVNTLTGDLSLEKTVYGDDEVMAQEFSFTVTLQPGSSGLETLPESYLVTLYQQDGTSAEIEVPLNSSGQIVLNGFKHGEKTVIHGIPIGSVWTIEETTTEGFVVKTEVTAGETAASGSGATTTGSIVAGTTAVTYTNQQTYVLPETGGTGTFQYTAGGILLTSTAALILLYSDRKRRKEDPASS